MKAFYILDGVRRALASHVAGLKTVPAVIYREGFPPKRRRMRLATLLSPKDRIERNGRFYQIVPPITIPIAVEPSGARGQTRAVPLAKVRLV